MKVEQLFDQLSIRTRTHWDAKRAVNKITSDSRSVEPGDVFVACRGSRMDGHDFIGQAVMAKAAVVVYQDEVEYLFPSDVVVIRVSNSQEALAVLVNRFYSHPDREVKLIGVTGTNGKTTIAYLLHRLMREKGSAAYIGTLWYELTGEKRPALNTTPSSEVLVPLLREMAQEKVGHCIMEVSSHALVQRRVHGLQFELAMFTQLTQDHLDYHQDMETYYQAKRRLFDQEPIPRQMLINQECSYGQRLLSEKRTAVSFSLDGKSFYHARKIESSYQGSRFLFCFNNREIPFQIRLPMRHNISNVIAVLAALHMLGYDPEDFRGILQEIPGIPGRMERVIGEDTAFQVFVDYAHTPDAVENVLMQARLLKPRRILTLMGCGGDRDRGKRSMMGLAAAKYSDLVVLTSDNPRSENPEEILRDIKKGIPTSNLQSGQVMDFVDRKRAIEKIIAIAEPGDLVFLLGKGHENYQILGDVKIPFDDRLIAKECLRRKKSRVFFS